VYELDPAVSKKWFGDTGTYARMGVEGDGSCFFHSVCVILDIDGYVQQPKAKQSEIAHTFRCQFQRAFSESQYEHLSAGLATGKDFKETREALCRPEVWADEVMIKHAASVLNMNLVFLDMSKATLYCGVHGAETLEATSPRRKGKARSKTAIPKQPTGVIAWVSKSHFEPIVRIEKLEAERGLVRGLFEPAKSDADARMVAHLMQAYANKCTDKIHDVPV
jgi:hypothetical protein